jgi:hypothetical protein
MGSPVPTSARGLNRLPPFHGWAHPPFESAPASNALAPLHISPRSDCAPPRSSPLLPAHICTGTDRLAPAHISLPAGALHRRGSRQSDRIGDAYRQVLKFGTFTLKSGTPRMHAHTHRYASTHALTHARAHTHAQPRARTRALCCSRNRPDLLLRVYSFLLVSIPPPVAGRISPYFFNFGNFRTGRDLYLLGR